jgi:hypothetical protein
MEEDNVIKLQCTIYTQKIKLEYQTTSNIAVENKVEEVIKLLPHHHQPVSMLPTHPKQPPQ